MRARFYAWKANRSVVRTVIITLVITATVTTLLIVAQVGRVSTLRNDREEVAPRSTLSGYRPLAFENLGYTGLTLSPAEKNDTVHLATRAAQEIEHYRLNLDNASLQRAKNFTDNALDKAIGVDGQLWFPIWEGSSMIPGGTEGLARPRYSASTQGRMLAVLSDLAELTGAAKYGLAAREVFNSYLARDKEKPWFVEESGGQLWFSGYPGAHQAGYDYTAHLDATLGLYRFWRISKAESAARLLDAGATTARTSFELSRLVEHPILHCNSAPCRERRLSFPADSQVAIAHLQSLSGITGDVTFNNMSELLQLDLSKFEAKETKDEES